MAAKVKAPPPPWRSGFCGTDMPPDSHDRCAEHPRADGRPCCCPCHQETEVPDALHPFQKPGDPDPVGKIGPSSEVEKREPEPIGQATVTEDEHGVHVNVDWHQHRERPWIDGTGAGAAPLEVMVRAFAMAAGDLHQNDDAYEAYDETAHLAMLGILRASMRRAAELDALLVAHLHDHGTWGKRVVDGIGEVRTYRRPKSVKWDERGTAQAVVDYHMEQLGGEQPDPLTVVAWLLEAAAIDYYRTTALKAMGIDPEDYRHSEKGTRAVDVPIPD